MLNLDVSVPEPTTVALGLIAAGTVYVGYDVVSSADVDVGMALAVLAAAGVLINSWVYEAVMGEGG